MTVLMTRDTAFRVARVRATDVEDIVEVSALAPAAHGRWVASVRARGKTAEGSIIPFEINGGKNSKTGFGRVCSAGLLDITANSWERNAGIEGRKSGSASA
jgi:hypothetical protein